MGILKSVVVVLAFVLAFSPGAPAIANQQGDDVDQTARLRATEIAFALTMADRDHAAFSRFLAADTVFFAGPVELRGVEAVAAAWKPFFEGPDAPFSWQPEAVSVLDSGLLGFSSGPIFAPDGSRLGTFNSVWERQSDGSWKIIFDRGCPPCECD